MPTTRTLKTTLVSAIVTGLLSAPALAANPPATGTFINGVEMTPQQLAMLQQMTGLSLPPGHYLVQNGCVAHLESGQTHCSQPAQAQGYAEHDDDEDYEDIPYDEDAEGFVYGVDPYANGVYDYGAEGYGYGANVYGDGSQVYNDGTYTYSYGDDGFGYQGGVGGGYGYNNSDGSWFHRGSDYSGGYSVGSDSNGCIYTPNWSNC